MRDRVNERTEPEKMKERGAKEENGAEYGKVFGESAKGAGGSPALPGGSGHLVRRDHMSRKILRGVESVFIVRDAHIEG
jgi:hypothetical protein